MTAIALTAYLTNTAATTVATANQSIVAGAGTSTNKTILVGTSTGYGEIYAPGTATAWSGAGSLGAPSGHGWLYDVTALEGQQIIAGNWQSTQRGHISVGTATADIITRFYKYNAGIYTLIGSNTLAAQAFTTVSATYAATAVSLSAVNFVTDDKLYIDIWLNITTN